ncbi:hypothetical protein [Mesoterricola sediminis]|uniref:Zinc-finger domain-containing protein n=1 Tax=Mesoterricola sediminis TaxID=2927980 RepID=A0AA48KCJ4_9BACT|nr:hypothetical protein [Mesoterricola sediminis]BDU77209.1 hypothetical protein METESE_21670 [Mesoterricola sediminis]
MTGLPSPCLEALKAIEADPLALPPAAEAHVARCPACAEARVTWLAMEEAPGALAPAGYFDRLPGRVLRKLPATRPALQRPALLWALAAGLMAAMGTGGFLLGRANRQPVVEASINPAAVPAAQDLPATLPDAPFQEGDEEITQLHNLSAEEAKALIDKADAQGSQP